MRFTRGGLPTALDDQMQPDAVSHMWVRDEPPRPLDFVSLAALSDSFFPRIFLRRHKYVAIGTVSLTTYFHVDSSELREQGDRHVFGNVRAVNYRNGYFDQSAEIWSADAQLLASTHQLVYYRE
jgi:acyl-CoA thioesterase